MSHSPIDGPASRRQDDARDLQAKLYREIGISAVSAALRFTTQPEPAPRERRLEIGVEPRYTAKPLAA